MPMVLEFVIFSVGLAVYAGYGAAGLAYLTAATVFAYAAGRLIPRFPWVMWVSVAANALALLLVKLQPVTAMELPAILGISYLTLKVISYHVDLYRGKYPPEENFLRIGLYVTYLPQLFLGPIERYDRFRVAAFEERNINWEGISAGGARILWGLFKKLVIAARAGMVVSGITADPAAYRGPFALAAMVMYYLQLYADFSGGIDVIIGISRMLGIRVSENFRMPYLAESVQEFWRRWHISLSTWFREYIYIPLGGNRKGKVRTAFNKLAVFFCTGLWHGASLNFIVWGLINGGFMMVESYKLINTDKWYRPFRHIYAVFVTLIAFVFFRAETLSDACTFIGKMFSFGTISSGEQTAMFMQQLSPLFIITLCLAVVFSMPVWQTLGKKIRSKELIAYGEAGSYVISLVLLAMCIITLSSSSYNPFIYFRF